MAMDLIYIVGARPTDDVFQAVADLHLLKRHIRQQQRRGQLQPEQEKKHDEQPGSGKWLSAHVCEGAVQ